MRAVVVGALHLLLVVLGVACGPSAAEIAGAKTAKYKGSPAELFAVIEQVVGETYKIAEVRRDEQFILGTEGQWYNPEGGRESAGKGDFVTLVDRSVNLSMIVELVSADMGNIVVSITPITLQNIEGSPKPRELKPDDPNLPAWIPGRVDSLYMDIHKALKQYETK